jgi:transcriptional regulator with XRE-family HTH domain
MASFGEELKRERELRGISLKEIAEATKISIRFLEALEQDKFEMLPGGIFNRGFIRAYTRFIGVDGEEMVNAYMEQVAAQQAQRREQGRPAAGVPPAAKATVFRPTILPKRVATNPLPAASIGAVVRRLGELTEGRTSLILWGLALVAFVVGSAVIALSLMRGNGVASPVSEPVAQHEPPPAIGEAGGATSAPPGGEADGAPEPAADANAILPTPDAAGSPAGASTARLDADRAGAQPGNQDGGREPSGPFVSRPADEPVAATDMSPLPVPGGGGLPPQPERVHALTVVASEITRVRIECGGRVALFQELWPGQEAALRCAEPVVLSADNAGAVQYALGGRAPALLGAPGQRVEAVTIAPTPRPERREPR